MPEWRKAAEAQRKWAESNTYVPRELSDSTPVHMDDYMAGHRQGVSDERARLAEAVRGLAPLYPWELDEAQAHVARDEVLALLEEPDAAPR